MSQQFSQESLYEEPKPPFWRRLLPVVIVLCAGALAYYVGTSAGMHMVKQISDIDASQANAPTVQRAVIGADDPEIMVPAPTLAPLPEVVSSKSDRKQDTSGRETTTSKPQNQSVATPVDDNSIPFRPAEDYPPGAEHPILPETDSTESNPTTAHPQPDAPVDKGKPSPIPVPETPSGQH